VREDWVTACVREKKHVLESSYRASLIIKKEIEQPVIAPAAAVVVAPQPPQQEVPPPAKRQKGDPPLPSDRHLLSGLVFASVGVSEAQVKRNSDFVRYYGGTHVPAPRSSVTHLIAPHGWRSGLAIECPEAVLVSPQWLELSRKLDTLLDVLECPILQPLPNALPYPSMKEVFVATTGLSDSEHQIIILLAHDIGCTVHPLNKLNRRRCTHLICGTTDSDKFLRATEWGIATVRKEWLFDCAVAGKLQPHGPYAVHSGTDPRAPLMALDVLRGVVLFCPTAKASQSAMQGVQELYSLAERLGATTTWDYNEGVTHYIHEGASDRSKQFKKAAEANVHFVSAQWVVRCAEAKRRLPETDFPAQINPQRTLSVEPPCAKPRDHPQRQSRSGHKKALAKSDPIISGSECQAFFDQHELLVAGKDVPELKRKRSLTAPVPLLPASTVFAQHVHPVTIAISAPPAPVPDHDDESSKDAPTPPPPVPSAPTATTGGGDDEGGDDAADQMKQVDPAFIETLSTLKELLGRHPGTAGLPMKKPRRSSPSSSNRMHSGGGPLLLADGDAMPPVSLSSDADASRHGDDDSASQRIVTYADDAERQNREEIRQKLLGSIPPKIGDPPRAKDDSDDDTM
jgi:hypothetical protein